jgi:hypothetical protein
LPIPEEQLEAWSRPGSAKGSMETYASLTRVIESPLSGYASRPYKVFLQGSHANGTDNWSDTELDIVIQLDDCYYADISQLTIEEAEAWERSSENAAYAFNEFRSDVLALLTRNYRRDVSMGNKTIHIAADRRRWSARVLAAIQFRRYSRFHSPSDQCYEQGICFFDASGARIANFPRQHAENLARKDEETNGTLKPMIRLLKSIRSKLVGVGALGHGIAPSYFLEGLLYNVPSERFTPDYSTCFLNILNWLQHEADKNELVCANEVHSLLRDGYPVCWPPANCETFLAALAELWRQW